MATSTATAYKGEATDPAVNALTTIGIHVAYAIETTKGERPTSKGDYTELFGITSTPDFNVSPNTGEATPLSETTSVRKVELLKDYGDTQEFGLLSNDEYTDAWDKMATEATTAQATGLSCWIAIEHPEKSKVQFIRCTPLETSYGESSANSVWESKGIIVPNGGATKAKWA